MGGGREEMIRWKVEGEEMSGCWRLTFLKRVTGRKVSRGVLWSRGEDK